jgi:hypothetical protein
MFFKLVFNEIKIEFLKRKKIFLFLLLIPFLYFLFSLNFLHLPEKSLSFQINSYFILYTSIILFLHLDTLWSFINSRERFHFYATFAFERNYILFFKLFSLLLELFIFLFSLFFLSFFFFKNIFIFYKPILNSIFLIFIFLTIISLFSFFKFIHFPIFSFIIFYFLGIMRNNLALYKGKLEFFVHFIAKILPPFDNLIIMNLNLIDIFIGVFYILFGLFGFLIISIKYEFTNF